jgi:TRAP transporter TAXI family solute receptor
MLLTAVLTACGGGPESGPERVFLSVGTAPAGGAFFVVGSALTEVLAASTADTGWQVTAEATSGSQENIRRLTQGDLDLALSNAAITYFAVRGAEGWDQAYPVRTVMTLAPNVALFIAPRANGITSIADLRGKRVVIGPAGAGFEFFVQPILRAHGLSYDDFTPLNATQTGAVDMLADGSAKAAFIGGAVPTASISKAAASQDIVFVPFDEDAKARLSDEFIFFAPATIPASTYRGQDQAIESLDVGSMHLIAAENAVEELIYQVTKRL